MPFGLTNTPATFQRLMNHDFKDYLWKFIWMIYVSILRKEEITLITWLRSLKNAKHIGFV